MKLKDHLYEIWTYASYGEKHVDTSVGYSQGLDMFLKNLNSGIENYPEAGVELNWNVLSSEWNYLSEKEKSDQIADVKNIESKNYTDLSSCFRKKDKVGFESIVKMG